MQTQSHSSQTSNAAGIDSFIVGTSRLASGFPQTQAGTRSFVLAFGEQTAHIRLTDIRNPLRFLKQLVGAPPVAWGPDGFRWSLLDDNNPARHYAAFVFVGYWLPWLLGALILWLWELVGFLRYGFYWSMPDVRSSFIGLWHGRMVRHYGHTILPSLLARDICETGRGWSRLSDSGRKILERTEFLL